MGATWVGRGPIVIVVLLGSSCAIGTGNDEPGQLCPAGQCGWDPDAEPSDDDAPGADADPRPDADDGGPGDEVGGLPCDVREALATECGLCHGEPPSFGAPMALVDFDDLHVPSTGDLTRPVFEAVADRLTAEVGVMPPDGDIDDDARELLLGWIAAGAPEDPTADCGQPPVDDAPPSVGPDALPCEPTHVMAAHADQAADPFHVPAVGAQDLYQCFAFRSPFAEGAQATAWAPIIDDERVVHHWILYRSQDSFTEGAAFPCDVSLQLNSDFVAGWAPGGGNSVMPPGVGLELGGPDDWYVLQVHYHNEVGYDDALDQSGVAFCEAQTPQPNTAGILTLGTVGLDIPPNSTGHTESGTCGWLATSQWPPLHVIASSPHMHELGRGFQTRIHRANGGMEIMTDVPLFDFNNQQSYPHDPEIIINPGDTLESICRFDNPTSSAVHFGEGTGDEMCFNFVLAYPIDALPNRNCGIIF